MKLETFKDIIASGWRAAGIIDAVSLGTKIFHYLSITFEVD